MTEEKAKPQFKLTEGQLNVLETYTNRTLRFVLYQLNDEFQLKTGPETNWTDLGCALLRLLKSCDLRAFRTILQGMVHTMLKADTNQNPFVAAAMAHGGMTRNKLFEEVLDTIRNSKGEEGSLKFGMKALGRGELFATLWNLDILWAARRIADHSGLVEEALKFLQKNSDKIIEDSPDMAARFMQTLIRLKVKGAESLIQSCLESLLKRQDEEGRWDASPLGFGPEGTVVRALLESSPDLGDRAVDAVEKWLVTIYGLDQGGEMPEWPVPFQESQAGMPTDAWIKSVIQASIPAAQYLAGQRPDYNPAAFLLAWAIPQENMRARALEALRLASPYLPPLEEIKERAGHLDHFWQGSGPLEKSVHIMYNPFPSEKRGPVLSTIREGLWTRQFVGRHLSEGGAAILPDPWDNAMLFMTGCRYGIALLDIPAGGEQKGTPSFSEIQYQVGFMRGQGAPILVLWDKALGGVENIAFPGVQAPMSGIKALGFDSTEEGLAVLKGEVEKWAAAFAEQEGDGTP